ncbi:4-alpha-glucanotransferase [Sedimentibacter hydroxybenzoicus DSM 7310]|uniref:4-alpha-glucanotransferase n=1 Tax=Sedimentibacter hydroxybenzoicus DSM 7310 TaxID=1123245 RepID=A0A974BN08_SEDHY|nr:4-alpha-glucanotransferase [Sedimentibacter hydroxybenzoicus]NYB75973.1 4-alpha-glucanotransferase [Sedimentibacter hydroxybenzoicus DSM 7310]
MVNRSLGILLPVSSLPSKYGIGTFGKAAYNFIDFLISSGQKYWQVLPLGPVSFGDSPYSTFSVYAGNPYYIDLEMLIEDGVINGDDCELLNSDGNYVDYEKQFNHRYKVLFKAYKSSINKYYEEIARFKAENNWVNDYSLFMALKYKNNQQPWNKWDEHIKNRDVEIIKAEEKSLSQEINFWVFLQYLFYEQYFKLKVYANLKGISIIGDMPIYVAKDSVDAWVNRDLFVTDEAGNFTIVAGVPPDYFSSEGQLWGNPVYDWGYLKENSYKWWIDRIKWSLKLYDVVRIDHFRGFDEYWAVPCGSENAIKGKWLSAYGKELFTEALKDVGNLNIIAEDLGTITDNVIKLKEEFNFPGMGVLQFAFDGNPDNPHLPLNYAKNTVAYTGTHDNDTLKGWYNKLGKQKQQDILKQLNIAAKYEGEITDKLIQSVINSKADIVIIPLQDYLHLDSEARINTPSTVGGNWTWRVKESQLTKQLSKKIKI